ncbi:MAG: hypothetical protein KAG61_12930 [Bacteriovoracaceae bacterium]|nr:hypothetical protein [Bacteriovoracaceae bacterium]
MKSLLVIILFLTSTFAVAGGDFKVSAIEDHQGKACNIAVGMYRREAKSRCDKLKKRVDWNNFIASDCIQEKLSKKKFKASFKLTYSCRP